MYVQHLVLGVVPKTCEEVACAETRACLAGDCASKLFPRSCVYQCALQATKVLSYNILSVCVLI